jgi:hypothetical protein
MNGIIDFLLSVILGNIWLSLLIVIIVLVVATTVLDRYKRDGVAEAVSKPIGPLVVLLFFGYIGSCQRDNDRLVQQQMRAETEKRIETFHKMMATAESCEKEKAYEEALDLYNKCIQLRIVKPDLVSRATNAKARLLATCPDLEIVRRYITNDIEPMVEEIKAKIEESRRCKKCDGTGINTACRGCGGTGKTTCFFCGGKRWRTESLRIF